MKITISFDELVDYIFEGLIDFGYAPSEEEAEVIASLALDFFLETLGKHSNLTIEEED